MAKFKANVKVIQDDQCIGGPACYIYVQQSKSARAKSNNRNGDYYVTTRAGCVSLDVAMAGSSDMTDPRSQQQLQGDHCDKIGKTYVAPA